MTQHRPNQDYQSPVESEPSPSSIDFWKMGAIAFLSVSLGASSILILLVKLHSRLTTSANRLPVLELPVIEARELRNQSLCSTRNAHLNPDVALDIETCASPDVKARSLESKRIPVQEKALAKKIEAVISPAVVISPLEATPKNPENERSLLQPTSNNSSQFCPQHLEGIDAANAQCPTPTRVRSKPVGEIGSPPAPLKKGGAIEVPLFKGDLGGSEDLPNTGVTATKPTTFDRTTPTPPTPLPRGGLASGVQSATENSTGQARKSRISEPMPAASPRKTEKYPAADTAADMAVNEIASIPDIASQQDSKKANNYPIPNAPSPSSGKYPSTNLSVNSAPNEIDYLPNIASLPIKAFVRLVRAKAAVAKTKAEKTGSLVPSPHLPVSPLFPETLSENSPASDLLQNSEDRQGLELSLQDVVVLALQNNRNLKNAYLDRILQRQDLAVAEDAFVPDFTPELSVSYSQNEFGSNINENGELSLGTTATVRIPTGADVRARWTGRGRTRNNTNEDTLTQDLELTFNQPLLRGFGKDINRAPIEIARVNERINILFLKSTLIQTITQAIQAYRSLVLVQEQLKIQQLSLESEQRQLERTRALIEAGRLARVDLVQSEAAVASRQVSLLAAENNLDAARLALLEILDIEREVEIVAGEIPEAVEPKSLEPDRWLQLALENNPGYLRQLLGLQISRFNLLLAQDEQRWDFGFNASYTNRSGNTLEGSTDLRAGLVLTREFGDLNREQAVERREIELQQTQNDLAEERESLEIEVTNQIRDVNFSLKTVEQARRARELLQQQLDNEREKLRLGVSGVRLIDILEFEEDLVRAKNEELSAQINYLNALTFLEQTVGITLETWKVTVEELENGEDGEDGGEENGDRD